MQERWLNVKTAVIFVEILYFAYLSTKKSTMKSFNKPSKPFGLKYSIRCPSLLPMQWAIGTQTLRRGLCLTKQ
jgi:hypothetical protein